MAFLKKLLIIPPILIGIAVFMYMKNKKVELAPQAASEIAQIVRVVEAVKMPVVPVVHGFGSVKPGKSWVATARVAGEIIEVHPDLKKGGIVDAGTVIIKISPVDYELAIAQANANIRSTEARILELGVSKDNTKALLKLEQQTLDISEKDLKRQTKLVKQGTVSRAAFDKVTRDAVNQRKKVLDLQNKLRLTPTQMAVQQEQKSVFESQLQAAKLNLARTEIKIPFSARISSVTAEIAQFAQPGQTLAKADGVETAEIEAQIPVDRFFALIAAAAGNGVHLGLNSKGLDNMTQAMGMKVSVFLQAGKTRIKWDARFARISDEIDPKTRTVGIIAVVDGAYAKAEPGKRPPLSKGLFVEVEVSARAVGTHIVVPRLALRAGQLLVVGKDNRLEYRDVETGLEQGDIVVITKGLSEGDKVVVSDISPAISGMLLKPQFDEGLAKRIKADASGVAISAGAVQ